MVTEVGYTGYSPVQGGGPGSEGDIVKYEKPCVLDDGYAGWGSESQPERVLGVRYPDTAEGPAVKNRPGHPFHHHSLS